jgi:ERCC4-type nuclease
MKESPIINKNYLKPYTLKPTEIPPEFTLIVDTREQRPLFTRIPKGLTVMSKTLINGDYSVLGFENLICFERKSADLWPYVIDHEKTKAKMLRFKSMEFVGLIIELKEHEIYQFQQHTRVHPETVRGALTSFQVRYGVHVYMGTRENCSRWLLDCAVKFWKVKREVK